MNVGSRYIGMDLPKSLDNIFQHVWLRQLVVFSIAFVATHDIKISIFITLLFILIFTILLNENSKGCILPKHYIDFNKDGKISDDEIARAKKLLNDNTKKI
jgi:hypothetical protein